MDNINRKQELAFTLVAIICILFGMIAAESLWWVLLLLWGLMLYFRRKIKLNEKFSFRTIDICLIILGVTETILYFFSTYPANSVHYPLICLTFIFLWFCLNLLIVKINQKHLILGILTALGGILALLTMFFFAFFWTKVTDMGFEDITQFRYLYRPMGMPSNDWVSIMLAFIPFSAASWFSLPKPYHIISAISCMLISISIIVSFSRGAIIFLFFFFVLVIFLLFYYRKYSFKRLVLGCCIYLTILSMACIPIRSPLFVTLTITENTSQVRSIEGRINKWKDAVQLFSQYPVSGIGSGNFALRSESLGNQRDSMTTGLSTNSWLQLIAEKGMIGLSVYGFFMIVWVIGLCKKNRLRQKKHFAAMICGAGIMVCLLRETTFSTLFEKPIYLLLLTLLFWFSEQSGAKRKIQWRWTILLMIPILFFGFLQIRQKSALQNNKNFIKAYERGEDGWGKIQKSLQLSPNNAILNANKGLYLLSQTSGYDSLVFLHANIPDSIISQIKIAFSKAVALNPADASFQANLGVLYLASRDSISALHHIKQSSKLAPHQSIYYMLRGMVFSDDSRRQFVSAVYYSPDILDSKWFLELSISDSSRANSIIIDAESMLSDSLVHHKNNHVLKARLAKLLLYQGKIDTAKNLLNEVVQAIPNLNRPWLMLGDIASLQNNTIALQYYERSILLDPNDVWAKMRMGDWLLNKGDLSKALGYYIEALRLTYLVPTEHSLRSHSMYRTPTVSNDVVPPSFYRYIRPYVNAQALANVIAQGYEQEGSVNKATLYRKLANGEITVQKLLHSNL